MTAKGHILLALPFAIAGANLLGLKGLEFAGFITTVGISSLLPDIDEPGSFCGRTFWFLSWPLKILGKIIPMFRHRGATHFLIVPSILMGISLLSKNIVLGAVSLGWLVHTIGDMLTVSGIKGYLYPLFPNARIKLLPDHISFKTGGFAEHVVIFFLLLLNTFLYSTLFVKI